MADLQLPARPANIPRSAFEQRLVSPIGRDALLAANNRAVSASHAGMGMAIVGLGLLGVTALFVPGND